MRFPAEFYDNLLEGDWSRGRLLYTSLTPNGATYRARDDQAEFLHGIPLNITDLEVGPDGNLYFSTGGRSSQGGFWRIRYTGTGAAAAPIGPASSPWCGSRSRCRPGAGPPSSA